MKPHPYTLFMGVLCAAALASCANPPETTRLKVSASLESSHPGSASPKPAISDGSVSSRVYQEVNSYRRSRGAGDLQRHPGLDRLAREHSEYLRKHRGTFSLSGRNVSHFGFEGRALAARELFQMENVSENVAACQRTSASQVPSMLVGLWKGSRDHHKNMCDSWTHTGVGVVVDSDGMVFATQLFSTVNYSSTNTRDRFTRF